MDLFIEFISICSAGVINFGGNHSKVCFMVQILHRNLWGKKLKENELKVIYILGDVIQALETLECLLIWYSY